MNDIQTTHLTTTITIYPDIHSVSQEDQALVQKAREAMSTAYVPYSHFHVGCAVMTKDGTIFSASNQENASYGLTMCADRNALFAAGSAGKKDQVIKIAVIGRPEAQINTTDPLEKEALVTPCGACRQVIKEYEDLSGQKMTIYCVTSADRIYQFEGIETLLPFAFGPKNLQ